MKSAVRLKFVLPIFLITYLLLNGCARAEPTLDTYIPENPPTETPLPPPSEETPVTPTPFAPIPTQGPSAALVNGDHVTLEEYQEELSRYKATVNREITPEDQQIVINELIDQTLLAQAARSEGFQVDDTVLDERIAALDTEGKPLGDWLAANGYSLASFRSYLRRSLEAAWMRDKIIGDVPTTMNQIHVQQMLFYDLGSAQVTMGYLQEGRSFDDLASFIDPQTKGDLGWFPEGILTIPDLDPILFNFEVGQTSDIIQTEIGYHIFKLLEREDNRPLDPAIRQILQKQAVEDWIKNRREQSTIEITLPT